MKVSRHTYSGIRNDDWKIIVFALFFLGLGALIGGVVGVFLFIRITGGNATPSQPISAPTLSVETVILSSETPFVSDSEPTAVPTLIGNAQNQSNTIVITPTAIPAVVEPTSSIAVPQLFRIVPEESEARFSVFETFPLGTAVGRTNQIAGDVIVDFNNPANSQLGTIRINLRTLATDDMDRDRSIRCCVLLTSRPEYEFTDFVPTVITGLPNQVEIGQTIPFQVTGNMTLRGNTRPVTFDVSLTLSSTTEIQGFASATVNRSDYGILNDSQNGFDYHGVEEEITLEFTFVARAVPQ